MSQHSQPALERVSAVDNGRFTTLFTACSSFSETCFKCGYFDPSKSEMYRCHALGACPAASLEKRLIQYVLLRI